ncbi:hypothetical protein [Pseudomonas caspiana]|uniref:hypothetical protein n=1 Tax=Pseudomonas caspiana TaxID=1451454 RepID=UPI0032ECD2DF
MKRIFGIAVALAIASVFAKSAATEERQEIHRAITVFPPILYQQSAMDRATVETTMLSQGGPDMHILAPAAPLSWVIVYAFGSTQLSGWEYMTTVGRASTGNHGETNQCISLGRGTEGCWRVADAVLIEAERVLCGEEVLSRAWEATADAHPHQGQRMGRCSDAESA